MDGGTALPGWQCCRPCKLPQSSVGRGPCHPVPTTGTVGFFLQERRGGTGTIRALWRGRDGRGRSQNKIDVELRTYIVEDNATIRENLIGTLEELASVRSLGWADTEAQASAWLAEHRNQWELVIVDLFLKEGSGLGVLEVCQERGRGQRVVVLSNYATADVRRRCAQLGADAVFDKSNEIDALVDYCLALGGR